MLKLTGKTKPYVYHNVEVVRAIDGDTVEMQIDLGFNTWYRENFRLIDIDTPERGQDGYERSKNALWAMLEDEYLKDGVIVETIEKDMYGRWLCEIKSAKTGKSLNERMLAEGHAKPYKP